MKNAAGSVNKLQSCFITETVQNEKNNGLKVLSKSRNKEVRLKTGKMLTCLLELNLTNLLIQKHVLFCYP